MAVCEKLANAKDGVSFGKSGQDASPQAFRAEKLLLSPPQVYSHIGIRRQRTIPDPATMFERCRNSPRFLEPAAEPEVAHARFPGVVISPCAGDDVG